MSLKSVLKQIDFSIDKDELFRMKKNSNELINLIKVSLKKHRISADVFVGGSFAKNTMVRGKEYDIDLFVRFDSNEENLSDLLEKVLKGFIKNSGYKMERIHGSRDYFRIKEGNLIFEIIPVIKIKNAKDARNVTDLSYFHVNYVKKKIDKKIAKQILVAKAFCKANELYGAESYINGFSGYGLECLMIYYKNFEKMIKDFLKHEDKIIIDIEKRFKRKEDVMIEMNESRTKGPIILVDPTWRERNVLAALNWESFNKFKQIARKLIKKPKKDFFESKTFDSSVMKINSQKKGNEFYEIEIRTEKQKGDIAGTKLKKFSEMIKRDIEEFFDIKQFLFYYSGENFAKIYISCNKKKEIIRKGPPISMNKAVEKFGQKNKKTFIKKNYVYSIINPIEFESFINTFKKKKEQTISSMDISYLEII